MTMGKTMGMKRAAAWAAAACCAFAAAAREYTNGAEICSAVLSEPFRAEIKDGVRVVRKNTGVKIAYSDRWGGGAPGGTAEVRAGERTLAADAPGGPEGRCAWTPEKTGVNILTHTYGTNTLTARIFVPGGENNLGEQFSDIGSGTFRLDIMDGVRPALLAPVEGIAWSDRWDGESGGTVAVTADGEDGALCTKTDADPGEGVCAWTPAEPGLNTLRHKDGETELTARFLVMRNLMSGTSRSFRLEEADPVLGPPPKNEELYKGPYTWSADGGGLPAGLSLSPEGVLSGKAACKSGRYAFTATITDSRGGTFTKTYPLRVMSGGTWFILR